MEYICENCGRVYPAHTLEYRCACGGLFSLRFPAEPLSFSKIKAGTSYSMWRYADAMPLHFDDPAVQAVTMGEGFTPLIPLAPDNPKLLAKCDYYMPTLSFKDRGAAVLVAFAKKLGVQTLVCDSSGNAGTAIAAYAARAKIMCECFVPDRTSDKKIKQISAHGANVRPIAGTREDTANAAHTYVEKTQAFYASHVFNPVFYEGTKTYFFEVFEQMGYAMPDGFVIPVGNGTLLLGAIRALTQLKEWGYIEQLPAIYAVQAQNCAPIWNAYRQGRQTVSACQSRETLAEGIAIAAPARGKDILQAIRATGGDVIAVDEEDILCARKKMAALGLYVEITSAANYAGYLKYCLRDPGFAGKTIVLPLCGAGIKSN